MSKVDEVVSLIERTSREIVQKHFDSLVQNKQQYILFFSDTTYTINVRPEDDQEKVYSVDDLQAGLEKHKKVSDPSYAEYWPLLEQFETFIQDNSLFLDLTSKQFNQANPFEFENGKYKDKNVQGLFEVFVKTLKTKEQFKEKLIELNF